jgi:signal peptidase I
MLLLAVLAMLGCGALAATVVVLHLDIRPVLSGSMRPAFGPGAILVTRPVAVENLRPGMIAVFIPPGEHVEFSHRITSVSGSPGDPIITTKGDANVAPDPWHARLTTPTVPVVVATQPGLGYLMVAMGGPVRFVFIILGGLVVAICGSRLILRPRQPRSVGLA